MFMLGIDIGTTGCKSMLFEIGGRIVSQNYIEYELITTGEFIEQDAEQWWSLVTRTVRNTVAASRIASDRISAVGVSSQGISFVPVDINGHVLGNAISWLDTRAFAQAAELRGRFSAESLFAVTGKRISPVYTLPKIMWIRENKPETYCATYKFLMGLDYITYRMTGRFVTDYSMASGTMMFNIMKREWDENILGMCGIDTDKLPEVMCAGSVVGPVTEEAALEMGITSGTCVALGAQDQKCAAIAAGIADGVATVSLGTATAVSSLMTKPVPDSSMLIPSFALDQKNWILESVISTAGACLKWLRNTVFSDMGYSEMCGLAESAAPGANGLYFYPYLAGASTPFWREDIEGSFYGIKLTTTRAEIVRSLLEGIAYQIRANIEIHERLNTKIIEIRLYGGGAENDLWCQLIADITGKTVNVLYTPETANLGAAMLAGKACGAYKNPVDLVQKSLLVLKTINPCVERQSVYRDTYEKYMKINQSIMKEG